MLSFSSRIGWLLHGLDRIKSVDAKEKAKVGFHRAVDQQGIAAIQKFPGLLDMNSVCSAAFLSDIV